MVYDKVQDMTVSIKFLHPEVTNNYNNGMNNIDIADQLWGSYHTDWWMQKRKWWWTMWMWGIQLLLVNIYVLYKTAHLINNWRKKREQHPIPLWVLMPNCTGMAWMGWKWNFYLLEVKNNSNVSILTWFQPWHKEGKESHWCHPWPSLWCTTNMAWYTTIPSSPKQSSQGVVSADGPIWTKNQEDGLCLWLLMWLTLHSLF